MADDEDAVRKTLDELQSQLGEIRAKDPALAARLLATIDEAERALASRSVQPAAHRSIVRRLSDAVQHLEASHPDLAANLGSIIDALAQIGI